MASCECGSTPADQSSGALVDFRLCPLVNSPVSVVWEFHKVPKGVNPWVLVEAGDASVPTIAQVAELFRLVSWSDVNGSPVASYRGEGTEVWLLSRKCSCIDGEIVITRRVKAGDDWDVYEYMFVMKELSQESHKLTVDYKRLDRKEDPANRSWKYTAPRELPTLS